MRKVFCAIGLLVGMNGCCAIGAGIGATTAKDSTDGAIKGALIGGAVDVASWSLIGSQLNGIYLGPICAAPQDDPRAVGARQ